MRAPVGLGFFFLIENEAPDLTTEINNRLAPRSVLTLTQKLSVTFNFHWRKYDLAVWP
jgi:hypothetical protein